MSDNWKLYLAVAAMTGLLSGLGYFLHFRNLGKGMEQQHNVQQMLNNRARNNNSNQH